MGTEREPRSGPESPKVSDRKHIEDLLDEALDESFPASDPPAPTRPHELDEEKRD